MRRNLLCVIALFGCTAAFSQSVPPTNSNTAPRPLFRSDSTRTGGTGGTTGGRTNGKENIRERLVALAMQNPSVEVDDRQVTIAAYGVKKAKSNVLNQIALQGNLNEFSIEGNSTTSTLYPRYNIGFILPLGTFATRSQDVRIARENLGISLAQRNDHYRTLRATVLSRYEDYLMAVDLLNFQRQLVEDVYTHYLKVEKSFAEAKISDDEYTNAYRSYNTEQAKQRSLERDLKVIVLELEKYIGVSLDDVLKEYR